MIWTSETWFDDAAREDYQSSQRAMLEDDSYEVSDEEWSEAVEMWLYDERQNLDKEVDGVIVAFADLGLWNGRRQGTIIFGTNIANILKSTCDTAEWYCDRYNVRGRWRTTTARTMCFTASPKTGMRRNASRKRCITERWMKGSSGA